MMNDQQKPLHSTISEKRALVLMHSALNSFYGLQATKRIQHS